MEDKKYTYFQFQKDLELPIFVRVELNKFNAGLLSFLSQMRFIELSEKEAKEVPDILNKNIYARVLTFEEATSVVSRQIENSIESDRFGVESIIPKDNYRVYRHKGVSLMIYAFEHTEWTLGVYNDFGNKENIMAYRSIINRYLSWTLAPLGIIGFWGVPVEEGMVVLKQKESEGEAVYLDIRKRKIISVDGVKKMPAQFKVLRLDPNIKGRNIRMNSEELFSFLSVSTTYFDYAGHSVPVRQMLRTLSKLTDGLIHPKESFQPRTDLSL